MKKLFYLSIFAAFALASCQKPEYIEPTAQRQGITSLMAYFTSDSEDFREDDLFAQLYVEDPEADTFVIPVPYYFPEKSTNPTTLLMTRVRLRAELAPNCRIDPPLTIVNLEEENEYTFTNAQGESRKIIITGKRTKSAKCNLNTFTLTKPYRVDGFVNEATKEIYIFTTDNLDGFSAEAEAAPHATINTDLTVAKNYNNEQTVTVTAHDGKTTCTYSIVKKYPTKIPQGFRYSSARLMFNIDPFVKLKFPEKVPLDDENMPNIYPSLAIVGGYFVVYLADGSEPMYCDLLTGNEVGKANFGGLDIAAITSDEVGNMILSNHADSKGTVVLYKTKSVSEAPVQFHSFVNETDVPVGYNIKVNGNIDDDAVIILSHEGIAGVTTTAKYTKIVITNGEVVSTETIDLSGLNLGWGAAPTNGAKVVPVSNKPDTGVMLCYYTDNTIHYIDGEGQKLASRSLADFKVTTNYNTNIMEAKSYNNSPYIIHFTTSHFPMWGIGPQIRLFDGTAPTAITKAEPILDASYDADGYPVIDWFKQDFQGCAAGDIVMGPSEDGFKLYIYYVDYNAGAIGGFVADCIDVK